MPSFPTATAVTTRYFDADITKVYFLPAIASSSLVPTRTEMTAGTDLTTEIADLAGWKLEAGEISTPGMTTFDGNIPGKLKADGCSLTFYADKTGVDVRATLPRGTSGFIMFCDGGDVAGYKADVFPVRVRSNGKMRSAGEDAKRIEVPFSVTRTPAENVTIPANP